MNEFLELANQVNTIVVFDLIVMAGLWVVHDILKDFGSYIKEKIKSTHVECCTKLVRKDLCNDTEGTKGEF